MQSRAPSGLFPSGPCRPTFREPHPIRLGAVLGGAGATCAWLLLSGLLATSTQGYLWLTVVAAASAWVCAYWLMRFGDRGAAVGVGLATGVGTSIGFIVMIDNWASSGWPLW